MTGDNGHTIGHGKGRAVVSFDDARATVAEKTGKPVARYGWQNDDVFVVAIDWRGDLPDFDAPDHLVDKRTGEHREVFGSLGRDPAPDLTPIGNPPE